jgi:hypothetical protein
MLDARLHQIGIEADQRVVEDRSAQLNLALTELAAGRRERLLAAVTVRPATWADGPAIERLAQLDCAREPELPALVAELSGRLVVALSLVDGTVIADPFTPTSELVALLELRAAQLRRADAAPGSARPRRLLRRFRRAAAGARA